MKSSSNRPVAIVAVMAGMFIAGCGDASVPSRAASEQAPEQPSQTDSEQVPATAPADVGTSPAMPAENVHANDATTDIASAAAVKYDNQIVHQPEGGRGKDDGWFLVKDGKRRWITDDQWPAANGYDPYKVIYITPEEFYSIPEDPNPLPNPDENQAH